MRDSRASFEPESQLLGPLVVNYATVYTNSFCCICLHRSWPSGAELKDQHIETAEIVTNVILLFEVT